MRAGALDLFTIVIPYYNCAAYLNECLDSLRNQTHKNWKAIVVDDGSSDCVAATIVERFGDPRVQVVRHASNRGQAAALNTGYRMVRSEYMLSVDADDVIDPAYLGCVARVLEEDPNLDCVFTDLKLFGDKIGVLPKKLSFVPGRHGSLDLPAGAGVVMRRSLWERIGGYCEERELPTGTQDMDFWVAGIIRGFKASHIPEPLYHYRQHASSASTTRLIYVDHIAREFIYKRHREWFDSFGAGRSFVAAGYLNSAWAFLYRGDNYRALRFALLSCFISPFPAVVNALLIGMLALRGAITRRPQTARLPKVLRAARRQWRNTVAQIRAFRNKLVNEPTELD
jgi:glycosyltransferase involved in cell wall biosynthesis